MENKSYICTHKPKHNKGMIKFFQRTTSTNPNADYYIVVKCGVVFKNNGTLTGVASNIKRDSYIYTMNPKTSLTLLTKLERTRQEVNGIPVWGYSPNFDGDVINPIHAGGIIPIVYTPLGKRVVELDEDDVETDILPCVWHRPTLDGKNSANIWNPIPFIVGTKQIAYNGVFIAKVDDNLYVYNGMSKKDAEEIINAYQLGRGFHLISEEDRTLLNKDVNYLDAQSHNIEEFIYRGSEIIPFIY